MELHWKSQAEVGRAFGVSQQTIARWIARGLPGGKGCYPVDAVCRWYRGYMDDRLQEAATDPLIAADGDSPALEEYRRHRARLAELDVAEREKSLINGSHVQGALLAAMRVVRAAGERLQRRFGIEAHQILDEALDDGEKAIAEALGGTE